MSSARRIPAPSALVEPLESRRLLAADLAVVAASTTNLATTAAKTGTIILKNTGTAPLNGRVDITFVASAKGKPNQILGTRTITLAKFKTGQTKKVAGISLKTPKNKSTGKSQVFNVVARITPHTKPADTAAGNNTKAATRVTIKPRVIHVT